MFNMYKEMLKSSQPDQERIKKKKKIRRFG